MHLLIVVIMLEIECFSHKKAAMGGQKKYDVGAESSNLIDIASKGLKRTLP